MSGFSGMLKKTDHKPPEWPLHNSISGTQEWGVGAGTNDHTHIQDDQERYQRGEEKQTLSILGPTHMGQAFVMTMSSSPDQKLKEQGNSDKESSIQNQADSPALTHTWSPHSWLLPRMVTKLW